MHRLTSLAMCVVASVALAQTEPAADPPVVYVGSLTHDGRPFTGAADVRFTLYAAEIGGEPIGPTLQLTAANIEDGRLVCQLDFSHDALAAARFIEISLRTPPGDGPFTRLTPRQRVPESAKVRGWNDDGRTPDAGDPPAPIDQGRDRPGKSSVAGSASLDAASPPELVPDPGPLGGLDSGWTINGNTIYALQGTVGVGTSTPWKFGRFAVFANTDHAIYGRQWGSNSSNAGVFGSSNGATGKGVWGYSSTTSGDGTGVYGTAVSPLGQGVIGRATSTNGPTIGVLGIADSSAGTAIRALALANSGETRAIHGLAVSPSGWAGYFEGRSYFDGPIAIGTLNPLSKFSINGSMNLNGEIRFFKGIGSDWRVNYDPNLGQFYISEFGLGRRVVVQDGSGAVGIGTNNPSAPFLLDVAGNIRCNTLTETSSIAYKSDIQPIDDALGMLYLLRGVHYVWNDAAPDRLRGRPDFGFIAEEVADAIPQLAVRDDSGKPVGVNYTHVVPIAVEAIRELKAECDDLRARNAALESRLAALEAAVASLAGNQ